MLENQKGGWTHEFCKSYVLGYHTLRWWNAVYCRCNHYGCSINKTLPRRESTRCSNYGRLKKGRLNTRMSGSWSGIKNNLFAEVYLCHKKSRICSIVVKHFPDLYCRCNHYGCSINKTLPRRESTRCSNYGRLKYRKDNLRRINCFWHFTQT
jgi:hypothetical protein